MAAVLACGPGAVLSHRSAAELWGMLQPRRGPIHVTVPRSGRKKRQGLIIHRPSSLTKAQTTDRDGIAVTTTARTIADLRRTESRGVVATALRVANYKGWEVGNEGADANERSELERRFLRFCHRNRLPLPLVNEPVPPYTADFLWREQRLVVETDGWQAHRGRQAFEDDRARDAFLRSHGYEVLRFTWRQVKDDPPSVLSLLRRYLGRGAVP
jgi:very-short-patch-repair endonuclease